MDLTRRKAVLAFGAAVFTPLFAPGEAAACLFNRRRHRRVACSQPAPGFDPLVLRTTPCVEKGSILFGASSPCCTFKVSASTPPDPKTNVKFTLTALSGSPYRQNRIEIVDLDATGNLTNIVWSTAAWDAVTVAATPPTNQLIWWSTPTLKAGGPMPPLSQMSNLTITVYSNITSRCDQTFTYSANYTPVP